MNLHDIKKHLQEHFTDGLVTIVGSGLSCAEGLPGMAELASVLSDKLPRELEGFDSSEWEEIEGLIHERGLEAALLKKTVTAPLEIAITKITANLIADRERVVIRKVFGATRVLRLTRLLKHILPASSGIPIITTNYDRLIEFAAEEAGLGVDTMFTGRFAGELDENLSRLSFCERITKHPGQIFRYHFRPRILIFKPHGSIDWYHRKGKPVQCAGVLPGEIPLIITPGLKKFRNGYESPFDRHRDRANEAIDKASRFLILGYGFNDDHLETHLVPKIRDGKPVLLMTRTLSEPATQLVEKHHNISVLTCENRNGICGTRVHMRGRTHFLENSSLWDVNTFVSEVLEP